MSAEAIAIITAIVSGLVIILRAAGDAQRYVNKRVIEQDDKLERLENKVERLSREKNKLEDRIVELESSLKMAQEKSNQRGKELELFKEQVSSLEGKLKELTDEFYRVLKENESVTREISIKNAEILHLQTQLSECHKLAEELQKQLDEYMDGKI